MVIRSPTSIEAPPTGGAFFITWQTTTTPRYQIRRRYLAVNGRQTGLFIYQSAIGWHLAASGGLATHLPDVGTYRTLRAARADAERLAKRWWRPR